MVVTLDIQSWKEILPWIRFMSRHLKLVPNFAGFMTSGHKPKRTSLNSAFCPTSSLTHVIQFYFYTPVVV